jgi:hypothetical protein
MHKRRVAQVGLSEEHLAALVERSCEGDRQAWAELWLALAPFVERIAGRWRVTGRLSRCADERSNIVDRVMGELREDGFRRLAELGERLAQRDGSFRPWLWRVAANSAMGYVREHPEYLGPVEGGGSRWVTFSPLPDPDALADKRRELLEAIEAHRMLAHAEETLDAVQLEALCQRMRGDELEEIAEALRLDGEKEAKRLVRSGVERLRARFAVEQRRSTPPGPPSSRRRGQGHDRAAMARAPTSRRGTGGWGTETMRRSGARKKKGGRSG